MNVHFYFWKNVDCSLLVMLGCLRLSINKELLLKCPCAKFQIFWQFTKVFIRSHDCVLPTEIAHFKNIRRKSIAVHYSKSLSDMLLSLNYFNDFHWVFFTRNRRNIHTKTRSALKFCRLHQQVGSGYHWNNNNIYIEIHFYVIDTCRECYCYYLTYVNADLVVGTDFSVALSWMRNLCSQLLVTSTKHKSDRISKLQLKSREEWKISFRWLNTERVACVWNTLI